ncbi:MAG: AtpZ/AtpI family protein [Acidobacteria bacterium]|nr:AtpZ/AtpI family protein [Acidobacteriota bacterium]
MAAAQNKSVWKQIGDYASLGVMLPAATVTGYFLGVLLDYLFHTSFLYIVFLLLGIVAGFLEIIRVVSKNSG